MPYVSFSVMISGFHAEKESIIGVLLPLRHFRCLELCLYGIRELDQEHHEPPSESRTRSAPLCSLVILENSYLDRVDIL